MGHTRRRTLARSAVATTALALLAGLIQATPAAAAEPVLVVGLGDSYASGEGAGVYDPFTDDKGVNECHRSEWSWQITATVPGVTNPLQREHWACSGAKTENILTANQGKAAGEGPQINRLDRTNPNYVLLSIGGNDLGFEPLIRDCVFELSGNCVMSGEVARVESRIPDVKRQVRTVLERIIAKEPQATVVLAGYPQLVQGRCNFFDDQEAAALDRLARVVRTAWVEQVMIQRVLGEKVRFVDTIDPFKGHGACSPSPWVNKVTTRGEQMLVESMHPNQAGYQAYATATANVLRTDPMRCDASGCRIRFQDESVYYSLTQGAHTVHGSIRTAYESEGEERGWLGYPKTGERDEPASGKSQEFQGGTYWWRSGVGAYPVKGRILAKYVAVGDVAMIGTPTSKEIPVPNGVVQNFSSGQMFFKWGTPNAFYSKGEILKKYRAEGTTTGILGWPKSDQICGLQPGNGCRQDFDGSGSRGSVVYWSSVTGAHKVVGRIYEFYVDIGGPTGDPLRTGDTAGYPITDEAPDPYKPARYTNHNFQGGGIQVDWMMRTRCYYPLAGGWYCRDF